MALLRLLNRAAFICNICFLLAMGILWLKHPHNADPGISSVIIVMGFFLAVILNITIYIWLLMLRIFKKPLVETPRWLIYVNGMFLAIQLIYLFI